MATENVFSLTGFRFCPRCGAETLTDWRGRAMQCLTCGFLYYHNCGSAVAVILHSEQGIVFIRRGQEPGLGKLGLPGGFVDYCESAEQAARRETLEELGWQVDNLVYLGSYANQYAYKDVIYQTCDIVFTAQVRQGTEMVFTTDADEVQQVIVIPPDAIDLEQIAFRSLRNAVEDFIRQQPR